MAYVPVDIEQAMKRECKRRRYSERTIKTYIYCVNRFLKWCKKDLGKISKKDVRFFLEYLSEKGKAGNTMNVYHMAIRFLFENVLDKRMWIDIKYSKVPEKLPVVLSKEEIKKLFEVIKNPKHKLMIQLMYGSGLRVSELINLKVEDLELDKGFGWVRKGKGNKDRLFIVPESLKSEIRKFIGMKKIDEYNRLFTSQRGRKYSIRSLQQIIKKARKKAKINKNISCHTLRHSFATHLIENGCSVSEVQALLGHKSPETTFVYVHTASPKLIKIKSPLDDLK
jgi:site-specific recombinase XerD